MEHSMIICLELPLNNNGKTTNMPNMLCQPNLEEDSNGILWCQIALQIKQSMPLQTINNNVSLLNRFQVFS